MEETDLSRKILVPGATGNIGSQLVPKLAAHEGIEVRAMVRDEAKAASLKEAGAELSIGLYEEADSVGAAVEGIDTMVLITAPNPDAHEQASAVLSAAKDAGVRKVVRMSAIGASIDGPTDNTRLHGQTDDLVQSSGLAHVILRPHFFMQNLFGSAESIAGDGNMYLGMGDGKLGMVDVRDVVDSAEQSVISDDYDGQILTLTGRNSITLHEAANVLSEAMGRTVNYVPVSPDMVEQSLRDLWGPWGAKVMRDYSQAYSDNWGDFTTDAVQKLTGHPSRSFEDFAKEVMAPALGS